MNEQYWYLKQCPVLAELSPEQIRLLEVECLSREFTRGETIYLPGDLANSVLLLARGRVRIYHITGDGKQAVLSFVETGELFGELSAFSRTKRNEFAEATEKSLVVLMPWDAVQRLMQVHPCVSMKLTSLFGLRLKRMERRLKSLLFRSSRDRLIHLLLELAEQYGQRTAGGLLITRKFSHQDMAGIIGATRETVTITLKELQTEGIVSVHRRQITLRDADGLAEAADFGPLTPAFTF